MRFIFSVSYLHPLCHRPLRIVRQLCLWESHDRRVTWVTRAVPAFVLQLMPRLYTYISHLLFYSKTHNNSSILKCSAHYSYSPPYWVCAHVYPRALKTVMQWTLVRKHIQQAVPILTKLNRNATGEL